MIVTIVTNAIIATIATIATIAGTVRNIAIITNLAAACTSISFKISTRRTLLRFLTTRTYPCSAPSEPSH